MVKIYDILPKKEIEFSKEIKEKPKRLFSFKKIIFFLFLIFLILGGFFYFNKSGIKIEIFPKTEILNFKEKIIAKIGAEINLKEKTLLAKVFEKENEISQQFLSTGKVLKEKKAEGKIRVFNNYHQSQILVKKTRFLAANGKLFYLKEEVKILPKKYLDVKVEAAEAGPEYNIKPTTFSLPGLLGTPRYTAVYGKSFESMEGGLKSVVPVVSKEDLERAEKILTEKLKKEGEDSLKKEILKEDFVFLPKTLKQEVIELFLPIKAGAERENFILGVKIKSQALTFKEKDLENFAKEFILDKIGKEKEIVENSLKINYQVENIDWENKKIEVFLEFSVKVFSEIDLKILKENLRGKSQKEIENFLKEQPEILKFKIKSWPAFLKRAPKKIEKIKIKINL
jgi:hypothetical protein